MVADTLQSFAITLKQLRTLHGLTQEELAERSGVSVRSISDLERGISRFPHKDTVQLLADALHLAPEEAAQLFAFTRKASSADQSAAEAAVPCIGRERELAEILRRLRDPTVRLLTLSGVAGVGKTRLAREAAAQAQPIFGDDVRFVDLAPVTTARFVVRAIAHALDVREAPAQTLMDVLCRYLAERHMLLILDNCEHLLEMRADVAALSAACPRLIFLATSREQLGIAGEQIFVVPPLATPSAPAALAEASLAEVPAVRLFIATMRTTQSDIALTPVILRTIAKICVQLEGIPLAIELAAARAATLTPRAILAQLSAPPRRGLLDVLRRHAPHLPSRQQTMRNALAWSYHLLTAREQVIFRRLSVFVAGCTPEAASAICAPEQVDAADMQTTLLSFVQKSLLAEEVSAGGDIRYTMHMVVRAYGAELLDERKEYQAVHQRFAEYYADLVKRLMQGLTGSAQSESLHRLIADYENIRAALQWTREQHAATLGLRLAGELWWFWENRGYLTEGRDWLEGMLALWQEQPAAVDDETVAHAFYGAAVLAITQGDSAYGQAFAETALAHMHTPSKRARVLLMLGNLAKRRSRSDEALAYYTQGLDALRASDDSRGLLVALNNLSALLIERGDMQQAMPLLEESLRLKRSINDQRGVAVSLMNKGEALKTLRDYEQARRCIAEGLEIFTALGDVQGTALARNNLGEIAEAEGDDAAAMAAYTASLAEYRRMEDRAGMAMVLLHLGRMSAGHLDSQTLTYLQECAALYAELDDQAGSLECALALTAFDLSVQAFPAARRELQRAAQLLPDDPAPTWNALRLRYADLMEQLPAGE
jgi:predicted ATPase/DNA-binding XRE family transcriptional regulator